VVDDHSQFVTAAGQLYQTDSNQGTALQVKRTPELAFQQLRAACTVQLFRKAGKIHQGGRHNRILHNFLHWLAVLFSEYRANCIVTPDDLLKA
jgi:hypothetical protein